MKMLSDSECSLHRLYLGFNLLNVSIVLPCFTVESTLILYIMYMDYTMKVYIMYMVLYNCRACYDVLSQSAGSDIKHVNMVKLQDDLQFWKYTSRLTLICLDYQVALCITGH